MASSEQPFSSTDPQPTVTTGPTRYDVHLGLIPAVFTVAGLTGWLTGVSVTVALAAAAVLSFLVIADALFRHPPLSKNL